jgi:hypothetical protein
VTFLILANLRRCAQAVSKTLAALEELQDDESLLSLIYITALVEDPIEFEKRVADETGGWIPSESLGGASPVHCSEFVMHPRS